MIPKWSLKTRCEKGPLSAANKKSLKTKGFHASFILRDDLFWGMDECFCRQRRRFAPTLFFFSCLDARKEAKENQGARGTGQVGRVHDWRGPDLCHVPGKLPCLGRGLWPRFYSPNGAKYRNLWSGRSSGWMMAMRSLRRRSGWRGISS